MTDETFAQVAEVVRWRLVRWQWHPDWEDLCQEALIGAWQAVENGLGPWQLNTVAGRAADYAVSDWNRSARSRHRFWRAGETPRWQPCSFEEAPDRPGQDPDELAECPRSPDFAPALVERLAAREIARRALLLCTNREREALIRCYWHGQTRAEIGTAMRITVSRVEQLLHSGLDRYRLAAGVVKASYHDRDAARKRQAWRSREANRLYMREYRRRQKEQAKC